MQTRAHNCRAVTYRDTAVQVPGKWTRHRLMYCVRLRRWARHQQPAKYPCAAMTQQPANTYTLQRADCSTHPFRMSRLGASYLLQSAHEIWPIRPRSPFIRIFLFKTKFPPISGISFNIRLPEVIIRYQHYWHMSVLTAKFPTFPSRFSLGLIFNLQKISSLIRPIKVVSKHTFRLYLKHRYYILSSQNRFQISFACECYRILAFLLSSLYQKLL